MMRRIGTLPRIGDLARRTMEYRDEPHRPDGLRQLADAARCDPWGRAVEARISTDPADAPEDAR